MKKEYCVISHTHWDREWYFTFEQFRYRLVKMMDHLLNILEEDPDYIFHLDAQTIVLEDYLEIRPHKKDLLEKYIGEGRLLVGPWYVQNDFYLTSGEATIRNLMIGTKIAKRFGNCAKTGYIPDQFGNISQLPQIFNQFGIDTCLLGRGYSFYTVGPGGRRKRRMTYPEFRWRGKDGSEVLSVRFTVWYNNAQRFSEDENKNVRLLDLIEKMYGGACDMPYYLLMNGVDHLEPQEHLNDILRRTNRLIGDRGKLIQCTMEEFTDKIKAFIREHHMTIDEWCGELRQGEDYDLLKGTLSSRVYLKQRNTKAQNMLQNSIEPIYAFADLLGLEGLYPKDYLEYLWKLLIQNHPHDSICGCGTDAVHKNAEDRFARWEEVAGELLHDGMDTIASRITRKDMEKDDYLITVWNTTEEKRSGIARLSVRVPEEEGMKGFSLTDENGQNIPFEVVGKYREAMRSTSPINLPGLIDCDTFETEIQVKDIAPMGYTSFILKKSGQEVPVCQEENALVRTYAMENDYLKVDIREGGSVDVTDKKTGRVCRDLITLEDSGDFGNAYVYEPVEGDVPVSSKAFPQSIAGNRDSNLVQSGTIAYDMILPEEYDIVKKERSLHTCRNRVEITLSLEKDSRILDISCRVQNVSRDHRLRMLFRTGISSDFTYAGAPFDIIKRDRRDVLKGIANGTQPNDGCIYITAQDAENNAGEQGMAILNEGLYEYEHLLSGEIAVTLLRGNHWMSRVEDRTQKHPERQEGLECLGTQALHLGFCPNTTKSGALHLLKQFANELIAFYQPYDVRKFTGGRPAVQNTEIKELFFRESPYKEITLNRSTSLFTVGGAEMMVTAVKKAEDGQSIVVRLYNTTDRNVRFEISGSVACEKAMQLRADETYLHDLELKDGHTVKMKAKPCEIITIGWVKNPHVKDSPSLEGEL